jgi:dTDP-4-amino-4,6-dideoxygalactose transaminase
VIYFSRHLVAPNELGYVQEALQSGLTSGDGRFTGRASSLLAEVHGGAKTLLTTSGTHALELAALALNLQPGDEVVLPSFTFSSTANAFALRGCKLRFADIDPATFSMELPEVRAAITLATRAVVTVAYGGVLRDLPAIAELCGQRSIALIEDNAHGLFARLRGRPLGTFGRLAALSFHATKNISCGEGGALLINDPELVHRVEILREKGTDRSRFLRGEVDKYTWRGVGSSYLPSDVLAAVLTAQLENAAETQAQRHRIWQVYRQHLEPAVDRLGLELQAIPTGVEHPAHVFAVLVPARLKRADLLRELVANGITAVSHYEPLHSAPAHGRGEPLSVTDSVARRLVRLPLYAGMTERDAEHVAATFIANVERHLMQ